MSLTEAERMARLRLFRSASIGPITFYKLLSRYGSAQLALDHLPSLAIKGGKKDAPRIMSVQEASDELNLLDDFGGEMIVYGDNAYPEWLGRIEDAPPVLSIRGDVSLLSKSSVAIVGARNASANAKRFTQTLSATLGQKGQVIVSGLARGIDTAAHVASLKTGTIAVVAGGIDQIYPSENTDLFHQITEQGCVVSEMPFGTAPTAHHFPRRNRIVSGLSKGVVVVEASMKSGSLITARLAAEQGREVFAIPGFPGDPRAAGPNYLIQNGAALVQSADDILNELASMDQKSINPQSDMFDSVGEAYTPFDYEEAGTDIPDNIHDLILQNLSNAPSEVDEISRSCHVSIKDLQLSLLEMELAGVIQRHPGNRISKAA